MGELRNKVILQSRIWLDPDQERIPTYDYDYTYPITVYDAVHKTMDDDSTTLTDEIESIYRLIHSKQNIIAPGVAGNIMTWTGIKGEIGSIEVLKSINSDPASRSLKNVVSEKAIGDLLDSKVSVTTFNEHKNDNSIHITNTERTKWNSMAPLSTLQAHISNSSAHITDTERANWNGKADQDALDAHVYNVNNPHNTTAAQVGTYTRAEIDDMFEALRESYFNYKNIAWDGRASGSATLVKYDAVNWNPNFVLEFDDELPEIANSVADVYYWAIKPASNYLVEESDNAILYIYVPGSGWNEIGGYQTMEKGDMVITYPDAGMYAWFEGRFRKIFSGDADDEPGTGDSTMMWRPSITEEGILSWTRSSELEAPEPTIIKGTDGKDGKDGEDGEDGRGVPPGGVARDILVKNTDEDDDTTWKSLTDILEDMVVQGETLPDGLIEWSRILHRPEWYTELGDNNDGFVTQDVITREIMAANNRINDLTYQLQKVDTLDSQLQAHLAAVNPHNITPIMIGAASQIELTRHENDFNNPHMVTAAQVGLGNVNNTSDMDKPISIAMQIVIDEINRRIDEINNGITDMKYVVNAAFNNQTSSLVLTCNDGSTINVPIPINDIINNIRFDETTRELVFTLIGGGEYRLSISALATTYFGSTGETIKVSIEDDNVIHAEVIPGKIGQTQIQTSVNLPGSPTTLTQPVSDRSTRIATTEFVSNQVINNLISYDTDRPLSAYMGMLLNRNKVDREELLEILEEIETITVIDHLESTSSVAALSANMGRELDLTKAPRVHTSESGSTFGLATSSLYGHTKATKVEPLMDGTVDLGTDNGQYARGDHRHPTDTTRAPLFFPDPSDPTHDRLTGEPRAVTPADDDNSTRIATTEWVRRNAVGTLFIGDCSTAAGTAAKVATLRSDIVDNVVFDLQAGTTIEIKFTNENTATSATLNVDGSGAKPITYGGLAIIDGMIKAGYTYLFAFSGTGNGNSWVILNPSGVHNPPDADNSSSIVSTSWVRRNAVGISYGRSNTASGTATKAVSLQSDFMTNPVFIRQKGSTVSVIFDNADTVAEGTARYLNVQNTGASQIVYGNENIRPGMIRANTDYLFTFDGSKWHIINPSESDPLIGSGTVTTSVFHYGPTAPTNKNLLWIDSAHGNVMYFYNGSTWTFVRSIWG